MDDTTYRRERCSAASNLSGVKKRSNFRWVIIAMAAMGVAISYIDRGNLSVAMPFMEHDLNFDPAMKGIILSSFFWTYAIAQIPSGWMIDRLGARITYSVAAGLWGIFTAATSLVRGAGSLLGLRLLLGIGEAPTIPTNAKVVSDWFPRRERAFASSIFNSGTEAGSALSLPLCTLLIGTFGWRWSFAFTGFLGILWAIGWLYLYRKPRHSRFASKEEVEYIEGGQETPIQNIGKQSTGLLYLLKFRTTWAMIIGFALRGSVVYFFITWFPSYLVEARGMKLLEVGLFGVIPGITSMIMGFLGGFLGDWLLRHGFRVSLARKIPLVIGMLGGSVIAFAALVPNAYLAVVLLAASYGFLSFAGGSIWSLPADVAPNTGCVGKLGAIQNLGSQIGGVISPIMVGVLVSLSGSYVAPLLVMACLAVLGALVYAIGVRVERLPNP